MLKNLLKGSSAAEKQRQKLTVEYAIKTAVCIIAFLAATAAFASASRELINNYMMVIIPSQAIIVPWLIRLGVFALLLAVTAGIVAILVRPLWLALATWLLAAGAYILVAGSDFATLIAAGLLAVLLTLYLLSVNKQLKNQINFSIHPLSDMKLLFFTLLAVLVSVSFGLGYSQDAARRAYIFPPEIKAMAIDMVVGQTKGAIEKQPGTAAQKKAALTALRDKIQTTVDNSEKQTKPFAKYFPIALGFLLFTVLQMIFLILAFVSIIIVKLVFALLRVTRFTNVAAETREVKRLTLRSINPKT